MRVRNLLFTTQSYARFGMLFSSSQSVRANLCFFFFFVYLTRTFITFILYIEFNVKAHKGKQMLPGGSKTTSALQAGYFDQKFNRIMEGEAFSDPVKRRRQDKLKSTKLNLGKAFVPSNGEKLP